MFFLTAKLLKWEYDSFMTSTFMMPLFSTLWHQNGGGLHANWLLHYKVLWQYHGSFCHKNWLLLNNCWFVTSQWFLPLFKVHYFFFCSSELKWQRNRDLQSIGLLTKWWYGWSFRISQKPWTFFSDSHLMTQQLGPSFATLPIIKDLLQKWSSQDLNCCS